MRDSATLGRRSENRHTLHASDHLSKRSDSRSNSRGRGSHVLPTPSQVLYLAVDGPQQKT